LLPIKTGDSESEKEIAQLARQIMTQKKSGFDNDTRALERKIDRLVYALYGLTAEEIKIVEEASQ
jgi:hypothetical protein